MSSASLHFRSPAKPTGALSLSALADDGRQCGGRGLYRRSDAARTRRRVVAGALCHRRQCAGAAAWRPPVQWPRRVLHRSSLEVSPCRAGGVLSDEGGGRAAATFRHGRPPLSTPWFPIPQPRHTPSLRSCVKLPKGVDRVQAAAAAAPSLLAYSALHYGARIAAGESVLICNGCVLSWRRMSPWCRQALDVSLAVDRHTSPLPSPPNQRLSSRTCRGAAGACVGRQGKRRERRLVRSRPCTSPSSRPVPALVQVFATASTIAEAMYLKSLPAVSQTIDLSDRCVPAPEWLTLAARLSRLCCVLT